MSVEKLSDLRPSPRSSPESQSSGICTSGMSSSNSSLSSNSSHGMQLLRQASDPSVDRSASPPDSAGCGSSLHDSSGRLSHMGSHRRGSSQDSAVIQQGHQVSFMSPVDVQTSPVMTVAAGTSFASSELPELVEVNPPSARPLILQHPPHGYDTSVSGDESGSGTYINWLYDFYPNVLGGNSKDKLDAFPPEGPHQSSSSSDFTHEPHTSTIFRAQERYVVTLGAPTSIAQRQGDDTLTYLNKGQFYTVILKANISTTLPDQVKSVVSLTFFDEPDKRIEFGHWQYWYNLQANPNQKAFDIDRKNCENVVGKPQDMAYNAAGCIWRPELGIKILLRINCLSTEFSSQKGVKGIPLHLVVDTYEDLENESAEPAHRAVCRVKIFRDKGAERKNKDETRTAERRLQKFMKQQPGAVGLDRELGPSSVFHPPSKDTTLSSTSTLGPKTFLFTPQPLWSLPGAARNKTTRAFDGETPNPQDKTDSASLFQRIRERETKRNFGRTFTQAKEDLDHLEVGAPAKKAAIVPNRPITTIYVKKEAEEVYNALLLDCLTVHDLKLQIARKYDVPADMIKCVYKRTKKGFLVHFDDEMIARFQDEDDFTVELKFDNHKGFFDLIIVY